MSAILLDTLKVTTDPFAGLAVDQANFTHAKVKFTNPSTTKAKFRVVAPDTEEEDLGVEVDSKQEGEIYVFPLAPGTSNKLYLERYEVDRWVTQASTSSLDYLVVSTPTTSLSVTTGSTSARLSFPKPVADADYAVTLYEGEADADFAFKKGSITQGENGAGSVVFSGLQKNQKYTAHLSVSYPQNVIDEFEPPGTAVTLDTKSFTTSEAAEMAVTGPFSSYMHIDWTASVDGQGSNYRIVNRLDSGDDVLVESSQETKATIKDLKPGAEYRIVLQRQELGINWSDQNEVLATTMTSSLSLASVASATLELSWTALYSGASFEVLHSTGSGEPVGSGQTQGLSSVIRNLKAGTNYELTLVVYELGQAVGLARLGMKTKSKGIFDNGLKMGVIALIVILVAFLVRK